MTTTIESLQEYLERIAWKLHYQYYQATPAEDILQQMNLFLLERAQEDPTFFDQSPRYISRAAAWAARDWLKPSRKGANYGEDRAAFSLDAENKDGADPAESIAAETGDNDISIAVRDALDTLTGKARDLAALMLQGMRIGEAAAELGISKQSANYYRKQIIKVLAPVMESL